jgi:hypothetical protein
MNFKTFKSWLIDGCLWYTAISVCFLFINFFSNDMTGTAIATRSFLLMIPCGLTISVGTQIYKTPSVSRWARYLLHYVFTMLAVIFFLILPADSAATPMTNFLMMVLFSIIYWIIFFLLLYLIRLFQKTASKK